MPTCIVHEAAPLVQLRVPFCLSLFRCDQQRFNSKLIFRNGFYIGHVSKSSKLPDGIGSALFSSGDAYTGEWCGGYKHGWGLALNGNVKYEGLWKRNERWGFGCHFQESKYFGQFEANLRHGKAVVVSGSTTITCTEWRRGVCLSNRKAFCGGPLLSWTPGTVASLLAATGAVSADYVALFLDNQISGYKMYSAIIEEPDQILKALGVECSYTRRFIVLIFLTVMRSQQHSRSAGSLEKQMACNDELALKSLFLEKHIGEGGYGRVYRGRYEFHRGAKIPVAVKVFRPSEIRRRSKEFLLAGNWNLSDVMRDFEFEVNMHKRLRHPNIIMIYGVIRDPLYCVVYEFAECGSLFDIIHGHGSKLNMNSWLKIGDQLSCVLQYLHQRRILHCDLKTGNILITKTGTIKLGDFGLAHSLDHVEDLLPFPTTPVATPQSLSPEKPAPHADGRLNASDSDLNFIPPAIHELGVYKDPEARQRPAPPYAADAWGDGKPTTSLFSLRTDDTKGSFSDVHHKGIILGCVGTLQWMAPEIIRGEPYTTASDIYAFGVVLLELLTGVIPFQGVSPNHIVALAGYHGLSFLDGCDFLHLLSPSFPNQSKVWKNIPRQIMNVIAKCMHPDPRQRPTAQSLNEYFSTLASTRILEVEENLKTFFGFPA